MKLPKGLIMCFAGPSGAGKTTLANTLLKSAGVHSGKIVTVTTRAPRGGEVDGADYFFWTKEKFEEGIEQNLFFETENVHGNRYGTLRGTIDSFVTEGRIGVIILDVKGALKLKEAYPSDTVTVFTTTSTKAELASRLVLRKSTVADAKKRLSAADKELEVYNNSVAMFDHLIITDVKHESNASLENILLHECVRRGKSFVFFDGKEA